MKAAYSKPTIPSVLPSLARLTALLFNRTFIVTFSLYKQGSCS